MMRKIILDVETTDGVKPVAVYTIAALEYLLGWDGKYVRKLECAGRFPITPYKKLISYPKPNTLVRLYTETMLKEVRELVELYYPVIYRGRDQQKKEDYYKALENYQVEVAKLQKKWEEEDYLSIEPATPRPLKKGYKCKHHKTP